MLTYELHELSNPTIHSSCIYQIFAICQAYARHWVISRKYFTKTVEVIRCVSGVGVQSIKESSLKLSQDNCGICFCHFSILPCTTLKVLTSHINDSKCQNTRQHYYSAALSWKTLYSKNNKTHSTPAAGNEERGRKVERLATSRLTKKLNNNIKNEQVSQCLFLYPSKRLLEMHEVFKNKQTNKKPSQYYEVNKMQINRKKQQKVFIYQNSHPVIKPLL